MRLFVINQGTLFFDYFTHHIATSIIYKELSNNILKALRMLHLRSGLPLFSIWYTKEFRSTGACESDILFFDSELTIPAANYIKRKHPQLKVVYWFWNHIYDQKQIAPLELGIKKYSFDLADCSKYNLKHNSQFHFKDICSSETDTPTVRDCIFVGERKGRSREIETAISLIKSSKLSCEFKISGSSRREKIADWIPYDRVIEMVKASRCVIDIVSTAQRGLTLRPLEALFMGKKLLTNFESIKEYDFYHPDNIFIMGHDDEKKLHKFIDTPYNHSVDSYIEHYDFESWLNRFTQ